MPLNEILAIGVTLNWSPEVKKIKLIKKKKIQLKNRRKKSIGIIKNVATRREKRIHPVKRPKIPDFCTSHHHHNLDLIETFLFS